jgi:hypothetical protein
MALIPRALRPMTFVRRRAMRKGFQSDSHVMRLIALLVIGRPALVKQNAMRQGFVGNDRFWKTVAVVYLANDVRRKLTVREPEFLGVERLVEGQGVKITALPRSSRRAARAARAAS